MEQEVKWKFFVDDTKAVHNFLGLLASKTDHNIDFLGYTKSTGSLMNILFSLTLTGIPIQETFHVNKSCQMLLSRRTNVQLCNQTLRSFPEFPGVYIIRADEGHGNSSDPHLITSLQMFYEWIENYPERGFIIQRFVDTQIGGRYYSGRVFCVGKRMFPSYACKSYGWNTNLYSSSIIEEFDDSPGCLKLFPQWKSIRDTFEKQVSTFFSTREIDIGFIDFSFLGSQIIVWEACPAMGFERPNHKLWNINELDKHKHNILEEVVNYLEEFQNKL